VENPLFLDDSPLKASIEFGISLLATFVLRDKPSKFPTATLQAAGLGESAQAIGNLREFDAQELGQIAGESGGGSGWIRLENSKWLVGL